MLTIILSNYQKCPVPLIYSKHLRLDINESTLHFTSSELTTKQEKKEQNQLDFRRPRYQLTLIPERPTHIDEIKY